MVLTVGLRSTSDSMCKPDRQRWVLFLPMLFGAVWVSILGFIPTAWLVDYSPLLHHNLWENSIPVYAAAAGVLTFGLLYGQDHERGWSLAVSGAWIAVTLLMFLSGIPLGGGLTLALLARSLVTYREAGPWRG